MQINKINNNNFYFISKKLSKRFPPIIFYSIQNEFVVKIPKFLVKKFFIFLKQHTTTNFAQLVDITAIDYPERQFRFEIVYQLLSYTYNQRLTVNVSVPEGYNVDSITSVYPSAG
jgi:NADH:ubiquinone oxidoreductase subunit C